MNLKNLKKIDIKELRKIDAAEIKKFLFSRIDISICLIIGGLAIFASIFFIIKRSQEIASIRSTIELKNQILTASIEIKQLQEEFNKFKTEFPQSISEEKMIEAILQAASKHRAKISSFSPAQEESDSYKKTTKINLTVNTNDFNDMILFVKTIESLPYSIKIDFWSGSLAPDVEPTTKIISNLKISSVELLK